MSISSKMWEPYQMTRKLSTQFNQRHPFLSAPLSECLSHFESYQDQVPSSSTPYSDLYTRISTWNNINQTTPCFECKMKMLRSFTWQRPSYMGRESCFFTPSSISLDREDAGRWVGKLFSATAVEWPWFTPWWASTRLRWARCPRRKSRLAGGRTIQRMRRKQRSVTVLT